MIREGSVPRWEQTISLQAEGRAVPAVADHHQVIVQDNPVPAARSSDGTKGALLGFGGAGGPPAAVPDEDAGAGLARLRPEEDRASGRAGRLNVAHSEERHADPPMPVVQEESRPNVSRLL